jgi:kynurenine formamidase
MTQLVEIIAKQQPLFQYCQIAARASARSYFYKELIVGKSFPCLPNASAQFLISTCRQSTGKMTTNQVYIIGIDTRTLDRLSQSISIHHLLLGSSWFLLLLLPLFMAPPKISA